MSRSTHSSESPSDYEESLPSRSCSRVQLILQGSLHCMTCGDGMGSVKFIQLPLPEVLLSGTQHLTVQAVIEQSFDIINAMTGGSLHMRDILVKSPLEARLEHSARQYDNATLVLEMQHSPPWTCSDCKRSSCGASSATKYTISTIDCVSFFPTPKGDTKSVYEPVDTGDSETIGALTVTDEPPPYPAPAPSGSRRLPPLPPARQSPPLPKPRPRSSNSECSTKPPSPIQHEGAFSDQADQRKVIEDRLRKAGFGFFALQITPEDVRRQIPFVVHSLKRDNTFYRRVIHRSTEGKYYFHRDTGPFGSLESLLQYYEKHPVDEKIYLQYRIMPNQPLVYQPSTSITITKSSPELLRSS